MSSEREPKGDGGVVRDGRGTTDTALGSCLQMPLLEAVPTWGEAGLFSFPAGLKPQSHQQVLLAGQVLSQAVALPRSVFWGCGTFHKLREALQGKATPALWHDPRSTTFQSLHPLLAHVPPALPMLFVPPALLPWTGWEHGISQSFPELFLVSAI